MRESFPFEKKVHVCKLGDLLIIKLNPELLKTVPIVTPLP